VTLGAGERAVWGECQGSGRTPYQTVVDLNGPAFHCSCPSRKFPCKHALGLLLLRAGEPDAFPSGQEAPEWVAEWIRGRDARSERAGTKEPRSEADAAARAQRAERTEASRAARVAAGLEELDLWLRDLVRRGTAAAQQQPARYWETMAARLVDAQAPGAARPVREAGAIPASGEGWPERLAARLGLLVLLIESYRRLEQLPEPVREDVRAALGWTQREEELLAGSGIADRWLVVGQRVTEEERLRVQRTWLMGAESGRAALVLRFAPAHLPLDATFLPGVAFDGELVFWPGSVPLRAAPKQLVPAGPEGPPRGYPSLDAAAGAFSAALARNPWLEQFPMLLDAVVPVRRAGGWALLDEERCAVPLSAAGWRLLALSGGHPIALFGEWDGAAFLPLSAWAEGEFAPLGGMR